jgi:GH15 family glucan-1,4-alpha-glucosidase
MRYIEDYALIGNCKTAALIDREASIDWLCLPYFHSPSCLTKLLGDESNGRWSFTLNRPIINKQRQYNKNTWILETELETEEGLIQIIDFMPMSESQDLIRIVKGLKGRVTGTMVFNPCFDYGHRLPLIHHCATNEARFICGPDELTLYSHTNLENHKTFITSHWEIEEGEIFTFQLSWTDSSGPPAKKIDVFKAFEETQTFWRGWLKDCHIDDESLYPDIIRRSVLTLKILTFGPAGSIIAAPTTSLPEAAGESRNWDYRYSWPRDAALAIQAVMNSTGQAKEIDAWRHWLLRATSGIPEQMEVLYGPKGERPPSEMILPWLKGFANSTPVRMGNDARHQLQLDIYGSVIQVFFMAEKLGLPRMKESWNLAYDMLDYLEKIWRSPDQGIWEVRGPRRHFVHSKVMVWAAFNWCILSAQDEVAKEKIELWKEIRSEIFEEICQKGFSPERNSFVQYYGSNRVDASLLILPLVGFLPPNDPRILGTVQSIENDLLLDEGCLMRYLPDENIEGLPPTDKRAFILGSAWLGTVYVMQNRREDARKIYSRLVEMANDVGLLAEQYDPKTQKQFGNFPQAFSHIALILLELALDENDPRIY